MLFGILIFKIIFEKKMNDHLNQKIKNISMFDILKNGINKLFEIKKASSKMS